MTKPDENRLTTRQIKALPHFAASLSIEASCKAAHISKETFYSWVKEPLFKKELEKLRNEVVDDAVNQLKINTTKAAETLASLLEREDYPAIQRAAANDILSHTMKFMELKEIEVRLQALEAAHNPGG